jgi:TonB family protein
MRISILALTVSLLTIWSVTEAAMLSKEQPAVIQAVAPLFPVPSKGPYAMGSVVVEVAIDASGAVTEAQAVKGHPFLYSAAEKAAQRWLFASTSELAKVRTVRLTFVFKFMDDDIPDEGLSPIFMPPYQVEVRRIVPILKLQGS